MRASGWEHRLTDVITAAQARDFLYGEWDCCLFASAAIEAVTGIDVGGKFRGRYDDDAGCADVLNAAGGILALAARVARQHGFPEILPLSAQRGDVVLAVLDGRATLGVCVGSRVAFAVAPRGLQQVSITDSALRVAWRIA